MEMPKSTQVLTTKVTLATDFKQPLIALEEQFDSAAGFVAVSDPKQEVFAYAHQNGFFNAVALAYNNHLHLRLRPDDIWLTIAQGISAHINNGQNAEKFRHLFVTHKGKKDIEITAGHLRTGDSRLFQWDKCVDMLVDKLKGHVLGDIPDILLCDFTTTDTAAKTASQIVLMHAMKKYFRYIIAGCGIPKVTLEGTLNDWKRLLVKLKEAKALQLEGMNDWLSGLQPILREFVRTYEGKVNEGFWSRIMFKQPFGSGPKPPQISDADLQKLPENQCMYSGWILKFFPYDSDGVKLGPKPRLGSKNVPPGQVTVPFLLDEFGNGVFIRMKFITGFLGTVQHEDGSIVPFIGWAVARKDKNDNVNPAKRRRF